MVVARFNDLTQVKNDICSEYIVRYRKVIEEAVVSAAPSDTGLLRSSIFSLVVGSGLGRRIRIVSGVGYSAFVHFGHGVITPKRPDGVLSWVSRLSGERVFAKRVKAVRGNPFILKALNGLGFRNVRVVRGS